MSQAPTLSSESTPLADNADAIREQVSRAYANAITRKEGKSCCGPSCCGGEVASESSTSETAGVAAATAGYGTSDVDGLPEGVAESSFGCGNPLAFAGVEAGQTVLDLGSGAGLDLLLAARKVGDEGRVIGVDMTDAMIETARANIERAGAGNVEVRKGLIEELPVESASVDWVISNCVINLSPDKPSVFAEIVRVLAPGGRFSVSDIVADDLPASVKAKASAYSACISGAISETEYIAGLERAGLTEIEVTERQVYDAQQLRALVASDLADLGLEDIDLETDVEAVAGKVWSAKITGRKAS